MRKDDEHIFTFGLSSKYAHRFVSICTDDYDTARTRMFDEFGQKWAFQYAPPNARAKAGVYKFNLKELHI